MLSLLDSGILCFENLFAPGFFNQGYGKCPPPSWDQEASCECKMVSRGRNGNGGSMRATSMSQRKDVPGPEARDRTRLGIPETGAKGPAGRCEHRRAGHIAGRTC